MRGTTCGAVAAGGMLFLLAVACGGGEHRGAGGKSTGAEVHERATNDSSSRTRGCAPGALTVTGSGVGPVRLGMRVAALAEQCQVHDTAVLLSEGLRERAHIVELGDLHVLLLSTGTRDTSVSRIIVDAPSLRTASGIGVGSTVAELRAAYDDSLCIVAGETALVAIAPTLEGISFAISARQLPPRARREPFQTRWADTATVTQLWVHGAPATCGR